MPLIGSKKDLAGKWKREVHALKQRRSVTYSKDERLKIEASIEALENCINEISALRESREELISKGAIENEQ